MRATPLSVFGLAMVVCNLAFGPGAGAAESDAALLEPADHAFALVTNLAQLRELSARDREGACSFRLEGDVWWADSAQGKLVLRDATGAEELELDLGGAPLRPGERVRLAGMGTIGRRGAAFRLGSKGPVVDNDGIHKTVEMSGSVYLIAGRYPLRVDWFNGTGKPGLEVTFEGPGLARQKLPDAALAREKVDVETSSTNLVQGVGYQCYEGVWDSLPDFATLAPAKSGAVANFNLKASRSRDTNVAVQFLTSVEISQDGLYTFYLKSAAGSRLYIGEPTFRAVSLGRTAFPAAAKIRLDQPFPGEGEGLWGEVEGKVTFAREGPDGLRLELSSGTGRLRVLVSDASGLAAAFLPGQWVRATGFCESGLTPEGQRVPILLLAPGRKEVELVQAPSAAASAVELSPNAESLPVLTAAGAIRQLRPEEARRGYPFRIQGVVTCVQTDHHAFVVQDSTMGLYLVDTAHPQAGLPQVGEFLAVEGVTEAPGVARVGRLRHLGAGRLPDPQLPTWSQLLNGSHDSQWVEIGGLVESVVNRSNGWSRVGLRLGPGLLKVDLRNAGVNPGPIERYENTVIRLRGCMFADWLPGTLKLKVGQIRMYDVEVATEPAPAPDLFSIPRQPVAALIRFDPAFDTARRVKVEGQVVYVRGADYFMMDGTNGVRVLAKEPLGVGPGDLAEAVGFAELSGAAPVLRAAVARKIGHAPLPEPTQLAAGDLNNLAYDSRRVRVEGILNSAKPAADGQVLELQAGPWRFLARLRSSDVSVLRLRPGSRLELVGVYCAQGGYTALGPDVVPLDLLLGSPADIRVLASPPWWTLRRLAVAAGALACAMVLAALWIHQLRHKVEVRTLQLEKQMRAREREEHLRAMEQERARIAQDLHDELGSDITEIGMLAARARSISGSEAERNQHLTQMRDKARQMVDVLEEIVWAMNPTHNSLASLVSYFSFYAERFLGLANINWRLEESCGVEPRDVDSRRRHEFFLAFKEALTNIVRHSGATEVRLGIRVENAELRLEVADNGRGLPANGYAQGMDGITNMKTRIENLGGRFEIASQPGRGTTVRLNVPLAQPVIPNPRR